MQTQKHCLKHFSWHNFLRRCVKSWPCQTKPTSRILQKKQTGSWKFHNFQITHKYFQPVGSASLGDVILTPGLGDVILGTNILSPSQSNNGHFYPDFASTIRSLAIGQDPVSLPANFTTFRGQENTPPLRGRETAHPVDSKQLFDRYQHLQPVDGYQHSRLLNGTQYASLVVQGQQFPSPCV